MASSSPPRSTAVSPPRSAGNPNLSTSPNRSCKNDNSDANSTLVGWWFGVSEDSRDPKGHIVHISAEYGGYLARSYSPWQLATAKEGTPLFKTYVTTSEEGEDKEQAIFLKHKATPRDGEISVSMQDMNLSIQLLQLTPPEETSQDQWAETLMKLAAASGKNDVNKETFKKMMSKCQINHVQTKAATSSPSSDLDSKDQTVVWIGFGVGNFKQKNTGELKKELLQVPATLKRKGCFRFCLTVEEDTDKQVADCILEQYRTIDHVIFDKVDFIGSGKSRKKKELDQNELGNIWPLVFSRALNQQPLLSGLTTFNRINVLASSDPLTGLYMCSNGYLVTDVIQFTRKFGQCKDDLEEEPSKIESCDYVEAVKLTGDPDFPAGKVVFRAKVGDKYKLPPGFALKQEFGAVARYKGRGTLTGFQNSRWVDVEVFILGKEYLENGFAIGFLYFQRIFYSSTDSMELNI
ncbi:hypothetical protein POM88_001688 [Heracleum sosnowskyi]|uniref:Uncharacterized protein n=1 Tax=Heracleum sosnowskyi TaxID=360622 RepID=A0AAD8JE12_9APIA|nr:hypothetical protein POM88_001688 [Heracleum sosnowskyi]